LLQYVTTHCELCEPMCVCVFDTTADIGSL